MLAGAEPFTPGRILSRSGEAASPQADVGEVSLPAAGPGLGNRVALDASS
jgi:hypothetical protein